MDYIRSSRECKMSEKAKGEAGVSMVSSSDYIYFERVTKLVQVSVFTETKGTAISGWNTKTVENKNEEVVPVLKEKK